MVQLLIDEAWTKSDPVALKRLGYVGIMGYLSHDQSKCMSVADIAAAHAAGLGVGFVGEDDAQRALGGAPAGAADGVYFNAQADLRGFPSFLPLYYAVDFDVTVAQLPTVLAYIDAANGKRVARGYGSFELVEFLAAHGIPDDWQAEAWSGTSVSSHAAIYQRISPTLPKIPGSYDEDALLLANAGLWMPPAAPAPPAPAPAPAVRPTISYGASGAQVMVLQRALHLTPVDGIFGPNTRIAVRAFQTAHGLIPDGVVGPKTWSALLL